MTRREWEQALLLFSRDLAILFVIVAFLYALCVALMGPAPDPVESIPPAVYATNPPVEVQP